MKKIVSFFGDKNEFFADMNKRAADYAYSRNLEFEWAPQKPYSADTVVSLLNNADAGIIDVETYDDSIFRRLDPRVKLLVRFGVGFDKVDLRSASEHGIAIARTTGANTMAVAEMALTLILASRRQLKLSQKLADDGHWDKNVVNETVGAVIGILGFGAIGQAFARLITGFGSRVIAYDPMPNMNAAAELGVDIVQLDTLFRESDAISIHVPYSKETHNIVNETTIALMKPTSVIVNTSRGGVVDEEALYRACRDGVIRGAGIDVFSEEPLPLTSPLIGLDNVLLSPHLSSQTEESLWRIYSLAIDIAADFFEGKDSVHILNPDYKNTARK